MEERTWEEFRDAGLLWWVNTLLRTIGWVIVFERINGEIVNVFPAKVGPNFRGINEHKNVEGYNKLANHIAQSHKVRVRNRQEDQNPKEKDIS